MHVVGEGGDDHALEHLVRVFVDDLLVLEGAGLRFIGVADEIHRLGVLGGSMKPHFMPQEKPAPPRPRRPEALTSATISGPSW